MKIHMKWFGGVLPSIELLFLGRHDRQTSPVGRISIANINGQVERLYSQMNHEKFNLILQAEHFHAFYVSMDTM